MRAKFLIACLAAIVVTTTQLPTSPGAETDDVFAFIPSGGRTLIKQVFAGASADQVAALLSTRHDSREAWLNDLKQRSGSLPGLASLDDQELLTLADYLTFTAPLPPDVIPVDPAKANWDQILPRDGRDLALQYCQSCHIITVVVTQDRTREAWLGTMNKPSHVEIDTTPAEREALASYLVLNAGIPIDLVPEDLRAGGASY
jgi:hypothetical protein